MKEKIICLSGGVTAPFQPGKLALGSIRRIVYERLDQFAVLKQGEEG